MINMRSLSIAGIAAGAAIVGMASIANAAVTVPSCTSGVSVDSFSSCIIGDKLFTKISESLPASATLEFDVIGLSYLFNINNINTNAPATFGLTYTVTVLDPAYWISSVSVDANVQPQPPQVVGGTTVTKEIYDINDGLLGTIVSTNGSTDTLTGLHEDFIKIVETFNVTGGQQLRDASNAITQAVPEPASLGLFGLGLLALGAAARRRR